MPYQLIGFLGAATLSLGIGIWAIIVVIREPGLGWKPVWAVLSLVGVGGAAMVWSAPDRLYWFMGIALPTASYVSADGSWQPVLVRALFPAGALLVLARVVWHRRHGGNKAT